MASDDKEKDPCKVRLKMVRLSYPALFRPKKFGKKGDGEPKFSAVAIIDPETKAGRNNIAALEDAIEAAKEAKWGSKPPKIKRDKICLREGDPDAEETQGMMTLNASNTKAPLALDENGDDVTESDDVLYGGCYVDMIVRIWAMDNEYGVRINASLEGVKFRKDGDPFTSHSRTTADDFEDDDDDEDEDEKPRRRRNSRDDDEDEKPKRRGRSSRDDDEDEDDKPKRRRGRDDDEDEAPKSRRGGRSSRDEDEDEDEAPKRRGRAAQGRSRGDDDEDESPKRRGRSSRDDEDEDEAPKRRRNSRDDDEDEAPKRRRPKDDDDEPKSRRRSRSRDDDEY